MKKRSYLFLAGLGSLLGCRVTGSAVLPSEAEHAFTLPAPVLDAAFWEHWGDGRAELAGYDLTMPRYGELRRGKAVSIFVTEALDEGSRVKIERPEKGQRPFSVMKLNLVKDFATGIYDYNTMASIFISLEEGTRTPKGYPAKVSYSSQEWCGHVYRELLFGPEQITDLHHSYFQGESGTSTLPQQIDGISEDSLFLWARGLAAPRMKVGERRELKFLPSLSSRRFAHRKLTWSRAALSWGKAREKIAVPAGEFETLRHEVHTVEGDAWSFWVEVGGEKRIVRWESSAGERAQLRGSERLKYWALSSEGDEKWLSKLGFEVPQAGLGGADRLSP